MPGTVKDVYIDMKQKAAEFQPVTGDLRVVEIPDPRPSRQPRQPRGSRHDSKPVRKMTVQDGLTDEQFLAAVEGFDEIHPEALLTVKGGRIRYIVDTVDDTGTVLERKYRLGGFLCAVDPELRYFRLMNPYARVSWSVQLQHPDRRVRMWYLAPPKSEEIIAFRRLLRQLEAGEISIVRR